MYTMLLLGISGQYLPNVKSQRLMGAGMTELDMIFAGFVLFSLAVFVYLGKRGAGV